MHAYASLIAQQHLDSLLAEAARERLLNKASRRSLRDRITSAVASIKSVMTETAEAGSILPTLGDYPYKS